MTEQACQYVLPEKLRVDIDIELNKLNALLFILEQQAGLTREQALRVAEVLEQLT